MTETENLNTQFLESSELLYSVANSASKGFLKTSGTPRAEITLRSIQQFGGEMPF